ncbi:MAG: hypothetical protein ACRDN6_12150 [Gaiellaceae bacterium]
MHDQTIWLPPRATAFTEVCEACEEEQSDGVPWATVSGTLSLGDAHGWATCPRGHEVRVLRMGMAMPAGALR